ncbi:MAG TPA: hypothetical protein VHR66_13130 [Gemmataceae bacterium]|nr:hypothetical protein [Gemmataceae bacterium]
MLTGKTNAFAHSNVIAYVLRNVSLASVDPDNGGAEFGFVYQHALNSLAVKSTKFKFDPNGPSIQFMPSSDFEVAKA